MATDTSYKVISDFLKAFGVDPLKTTKFQLTIEVNDIVKVEMIQYADKESLRNAGELIQKKYNVELKERDE